MPFSIVRQDITEMGVDAIVNAANTQLQMGGGVCGAIFQAAGAAQMQAACEKLAPVRTGQAVITPGFSLPARYVIHTPGPVYSRWKKARCRCLLHASYTKSLELAAAKGCGSIAFPLISSGIYGYPKDEALEVAREAVMQFLDSHDMTVYLVVFDKSAFRISQSLLGKVESYIDEHYIDDRYPKEQIRSRQLLETEKEAEAPPSLKGKAPSPQKPSTPRAAAFIDIAAAMGGIDSLLNHLDEPFSEALLKLIDAKGKTDVEVYKKANIDRKLFSKIRKGKGYTPKKPTILALAVALELTLPETDSLLGRAGYALSHASKFDVIVEYFIVSGRYNIFEINEVLFAYDQPLLGS